jgi:type II secretory pathway component PulL
MKIGFIDWTEKELNLYVFEKNGEILEHVDSHSVQIENDLNQLLITSLLKDNIENIYLSIPLNLLTLREKSFPFSDRDKIRDTIAFELEGMLLGNISDYSVEHVIIESSDTGSKVMAVCLEKTRLLEIIDTFSSAGIDPKIVTSIDLWLYGGKAEYILEKPISDKTLRIEAAKQELTSPSINLRQDELAYTGDIEKFKKNLRSSTILILIFLIILSANSLFGLASAKNKNVSLTKQINTIYRNVFPEDKKIVNLERQFRGHLNRLKSKKASLGGIPVLDILRRVAENSGKDVTLNEFNADGKNIVLKGTAKSFEDVESVKNMLSSAFESVRVTKSSADTDKKIGFTIVMKEKIL